MTIQNNIIWRARIIYVFIVILGCLILGKALWVMTVERKKWMEEAEMFESVRPVPIKPNRGDICAEDGRILATSVPFYKLYFDALAVKKEVFLQQIDSLAYCLSNFFKDKTPTHYKNKLNRARQGKDRYLLLNARKVNYNELKIIQKFPIFRLGRNRGGFRAELCDERIQPHENLAVRTIGYLNESATGVREGKVGLEAAFENRLKGKDGWGIKRIMAGSRMTLTEQEPIDGDDVITTINVDYQDIVQHALYKQLEKCGATHGTAILMEVKTGDIKAMANLTKNMAGNYVESHNFAISGAGEPGSVIKAASMIALLEDEYVSPKDTIDFGTSGVYRFYDKKMHESHGGVGKITVAQIIEKSANGISKLVYDKYKNHPEKFVDRWYAMGLNEETGICLSGEAKPYIKYPTDKTWTGITLPWMSVGYELKITPLQVLAFYNAIANKGQRMRPRLVKEIRNRGEVVEQFEPEEVGGKICSSKTLRAIQEMLKGVVKNGTARNIYTDKYEIAGKTGTARLVINGAYKGYRASFVGYFPADSPLYSCVIVIDNPDVRKGFFATTVAAPVFREISDKVYSMAYVQYAKPEYFPDTVLPVSKNGLKYDFETIFDILDIELEGEKEVKNTDWVITVSNGAENMILKPRRINYSTVPNVNGMGLRDALYVLENSGLKVGFSGSGMVRKQSLQPGGEVPQGTYIQIELR